MSPQVPFQKSAIDASGCLSKGWDIVSRNYLMYIGMFVVVILISIGISLIPYVGSIINIVVAGPLYCGILMAILTAFRDEEPQFSMMFEGFSRFLPVILLQLIQALPWFIVGGFIAGYISYMNFSANTGPGVIPSGPLKGVPLNIQVIFPIILIYLVAFVISIIQRVFFFLALPLVADRNMGVVEAVKLSFQAGANNIGGILLVLLFEILLAIAGALACGIGIIFAVPVIFALEIAAYKQVFPDDREYINNEPPNPAAYGGTYGFGQ